MRITDLLDVRAIKLNAAPKDKNEALDQAIDLMVASGKISDKEAYRNQVYAREAESTTGVGDGIAIPHGRCAAVKTAGLAAMVIPDGVEFASLDGKPVTLLFLIAAPDTKDNIHLQVLSKLSVLLMNEDFCAALRAAKTVEEFMNIVAAADDKEAGIDDRYGGESSGAAGTPELLAVTSCPTGIAHTYMAAEGLEKAAQKANVSIKIETRGSSGAKNVLSDEEIRSAKAIIVAADAKVPLARFEGKKVIITQVSDGINKADELVERALHGEVPVYHAASESSAEQSADTSGAISAHSVYTWLMNGVSHMLPFVVGGGILIALAFLIDTIALTPEEIKEAGTAFGTVTPAANLFKTIGNVAFGFMLPVLAGYIAEAIGDRPALAVGFVGGMMATNGKSGFLGALVAGFASGFFVRWLEKVSEGFPEVLKKIAPVLLYPLIGILGIGLAMNFVIEPIFGAINTALSNALSSMSGSASVLLGAILGGMMAVDMGGPFNKAAYVFGNGALAYGTEAGYMIMASVMIGGMVPPCAIALSTLLFKDKYTKQERDAAPTSFIMGLAFITEGAIPYAAADPAHVLPSCIAGSALAGALSMVFKCTLMAPHGGIFVFPVVGNWFGYLIALAAGTVVSACLLGILKKKVAA